MDAAVSERLPSRREIRSVGPSGNYWYVVEVERNVRPGQVVEVKFWKRSFALFRTESGDLRAVENRCAHRQLALTVGRVEGENLVCQYHGWKFDGCGKCVHVSHEVGSAWAELPNIRIESYPVRTKYGYIWLFPGDPALADQVPIPEIPQLEGAKPWEFSPVDATIGAHFSMVVENVSDFNHAYLHRRKQPFTHPKLREWGRVDDTITLTYDASFSGNLITRLISEGRGAALDRIEISYQYPYQRSNICGKNFQWLFMLPIDERTTRCFFVFLIGRLEVPVTRWRLPTLLRKPVLGLANRLYIIPVLHEDKWVLEAEQRGFDQHPENPQIEFNPVVPELQRMTIAKWKDYQESERLRLGPRQLESEAAREARA